MVVVEMGEVECSESAMQVAAVICVFGGGRLNVCLYFARNNCDTTSTDVIFYHILACVVETWWLVVRGVFAWRSCFVSALAAGMATGAAVGVAAGAAGWVIGRVGGWKGW